jgi:hypothetical protein
MTLNNSANRLNLTLVDPEWDFLEGLLAPDFKGATMYFDFGYTSAGTENPDSYPLRSPFYQVRVINITPSFEIDHVRLSVEALSAPIGSKDGEGGQGSINFKWGPGSEATWNRGEENRTPDGLPDPIAAPAGTPRLYREGLTIAQLVQEIAWKHNLIPVIKDTEPLLFTDQLEGSEEINKIWTQDHSSDLAFIKNALLPHANVKGRPLAGYTLRMSDDVDMAAIQAGKPVHKLLFYPMALDAPPKFEYVFMRGKDSAVVSFTPELDNWTMVGVGAAGSQTPSNDHVTGSRAISQFSNELTPEKKITDRATWTREGNQGVSKWYRAFPGAYRTHAQAYAFGNQRFTDMFNRQITATLVVQGHPPGPSGTAARGSFGPQVSDMIQVVVPKKDGTLHYTSGLYIVQDITHTISGGTFTTTLKLLKNALRSNEKNLIATAEAVGELNQAVTRLDTT